MGKYIFHEIIAPVAVAAAMVAVITVGMHYVAGWANSIGEVWRQEYEEIEFLVAQRPSLREMVDAAMEDDCVTWGEYRVIQFTASKSALAEAKDRLEARK